MITYACRISYNEIFSINYSFSQKQNILYILKLKGGPVNEILIPTKNGARYAREKVLVPWLELDDIQYDIQIKKDDSKSYMEFRWKQKDIKLLT